MPPCKHTEIQTYFPLLSVVLPTFFPLWAAVCFQLLFPSSPSFSPCAWVSNELVLFLFTATGIFFFPSPSPSPPFFPHLLSCFLLSMSLLPQGFSGFFFSVILVSFTFFFNFLKNFNYIPMALENHRGLPTAVAHVRPMWSSSVF